MVKLFLNAGDNPAGPGLQAAAAPGAGPGPVEIPVGVQQINDAIVKFMPMVEQMTGLNRREISIQVLRSGLRGGGLNSILDAITGNKPAPEAKFIRYVKTFAIWVPIAVLLFGVAVVSVILYAKLIMQITAIL